MYELDPEIRKTLMERLPEWVQDVRFTESMDASGDTALLVFLVVDPESREHEDAGKLDRAVGLVRKVFTEHGSSVWPYVRFAYKSELRGSRRVWR